MPRAIDWKWVVALAQEKNLTKGAGRKTKRLPTRVSAKLIASAVKKAMIWFFVIPLAKIPTAE